MRYALCSVPAAAVRLEPNHRTEMVNQLLYGEAVEVLESRDEWLRVRSLYDEYEGWVTWHLIEEVDEALAMAPPRFYVKAVTGSVETNEGPLHLPMGAVLHGFHPESGKLANEQYRYNGAYGDAGSPSDATSIIRTGHTWMHAPYLWGGKTIMGVDCSGFVQTVFKVHGINLLRDAFQQAEQGVPVADISDAQPGDLAFFHNEKGRITHVGMLLNSSQILHASGSVHIDGIDASGITHHRTGRKTHQLHSIRRVLG